MGEEIRQTETPAQPSVEGREGEAGSPLSLVV